MKVSVKKAVNEVRSQPWGIVLFPLLKSPSKLSNFV